MLGEPMVLGGDGAKRVTLFAPTMKVHLIKSKKKSDVKTGSASCGWGAKENRLHGRQRGEKVLKVEGKGPREGGWGNEIRTAAHSEKDSVEKDGAREVYLRRIRGTVRARTLIASAWFE